MPAPRPTTVLERQAGGCWLVVSADERHLRVRSGTLGNRIDAERRVPRSCWELRHVAGHLELLATWPVSELVTHRAGELVTALVDDLARTSPDPAADLAAVADAAGPVLGDAGGAGPIESRVWSAVHPLLQVPLAQGAVVERVPVALDRILRARDPRRAATLAFGRVTRPLVRALAASLLPARAGGRIPFEPAVLALMASPWCGPEQLVRVLATPPHRVGAVAFDVGEVDRSRALFAGVPARRVAERLCAALATPDGCRVLAEEIAAWRPPVPARPDAVPDGPRPAAPAPTAVRPPPRTDVALRHPRALREVEGTAVGGHRITLPRTADELIAWGRALDNCLGGFRHAVAEGRTHVLGLRGADGRLRYAIEITRDGVVRQFEGPGNRQAPDVITGPVLTALRTGGVVRADGRRGRSMLAPA